MVYDADEDKLHINTPVCELPESGKLCVNVVDARNGVASCHNALSTTYHGA